MQSSAVNRFVVLEALHRGASSQVKQAQVAVLAARVDEILLLPKAADCSDVALEISLVGAEVLLGALEIVDLDAVVHADDDLALVLGNFDPIGRRGQLDRLAGVAAARRRIPEPYSIVVGAARQF